MFHKYVYTLPSREKGRGTICESAGIAKFIVSYWRDKVDNGIGLSYRPANLYSQTSRYGNPLPQATFPPQSGTMNFVSGSYLTLVLLGRGGGGMA